MKFIAISLLLLLPSVLGASPTTEIQDGQTGTLMVLPAQPTETGLKRIPDADHPFIAPGPNDQRGPCPAMSTLANHGYIPRNGVASFEEIVLGIMEAFNIELHMAANMAAGNFLARGNPFVDKISVGGVSPLVPPLPGKIDGPETGGIAKHGRSEGDASLTRADAFIGDNRNFQQRLFNMDLTSLRRFGDDGPDGPKTVFNLATMIDMRNRNIAFNQRADPKFEINARRFGAGNAGPANFLTVFANGTTGRSTERIMTSFLRDQRFPENWFRSATLIDRNVQGAVIAQIAAGVTVVPGPGRNNAQGVFVADPPAPAPFNVSAGCTAYWVTNQDLPAVLVNTTGIFKKNVDFLTDIQFDLSGCADRTFPNGPAGV